MPAAKTNFVIEKCASFRQRLVYKTGSGRPVNLTNSSAKMQVRASASSQTVLLEISTANGYIKPLGASGAIEILVPADVTTGIAFTQGVYDLVVTFADGTKTRILEGKITATDGVTR